MTKSAIEEQAKFGSSVIRNRCVLPITFGKVQDCIENNEEMDQPVELPGHSGSRIKAVTAPNMFGEPYWKNKQEKNKTCGNLTFNMPENSPHNSG